MVKYSDALWPTKRVHTLSYGDSLCWRPAWNINQKTKAYMASGRSASVFLIWSRLEVSKFASNGESGLRSEKTYRSWER